MTRMQSLGKETSALLTIALPLMFAYLAGIAMVITTENPAGLALQPAFAAANRLNP